MAENSTDPSKSKLSYKLANRRRFSKRQMSFFALAFAVIGSWILLRVFAAAPLVATLEAEQMNLPIGASIVQDASASAGQAIKMTGSGTAVGAVNLPSSSESLSVTAKGSRCKGAWPRLSISIDSRTILSNLNVSNSNWRVYSGSAAFSAGSHSVNINYSSSKGACQVLYVDVTNFFGLEQPPAVAPTVALSASPQSVTPGSASTLTWNSANADSCTASGAWSGSKPTSGSSSTGALNISSTYILTCIGKGGSASASTTVTVMNPLAIPNYGFALGYRTITRSATDLAFELDQVKKVANGNPVVVRADSINNSTGQSQLKTWIDAVKARGFEPMLVLFGTGGVKSPADVSSFATAQATKWKGIVKLYEFMNEPDLNGWTPEEYTADLKVAYSSIKAVDPSAKVIAGALWKWDSGSTAKPYVSPGVGGTIEWVKRMYAAGAKDNFDMLSLHLYGDPDTRAPSWNIWDWAFYTNPNVRSVMNTYGDSVKPIISTESGGSATKTGDSEQTQSTKIGRGFNHLASGQIGMYLVYSMIDDEVPGFGLLRPDRTPRLAWYTYQQQAR